MRLTIVIGGAVGALATIGVAVVRMRHLRKISLPQTLHLTLVGFGAVNRALVRLIAKDSARLLREHNMVVAYSAIIARHGAWEATGPGSELSAIDAALLAEKVKPLSQSCLPPGMRVHPLPSVGTIREIIARAASLYRGQRCIAEAIDVDYASGEPASSYLSQALHLGSHAVSANKGPVVHHLDHLEALAKASGVRYLYESAVMDGVPIFSCWRAGFQPGGAQLMGFRGCLNSTSSVVLSGMQEGESMEVSLRRAQEAGIAEADPSGDLRGMDAAVKVVALARALALHRAADGNAATSALPLTLDQVCEGLSPLPLYRPCLDDDGRHANPPRAPAPPLDDDRRHGAPDHRASPGRWPTRAQVATCRRRDCTRRRRLRHAASERICETRGACTR